MKSNQIRDRKVSLKTISVIMLVAILLTSLTTYFVFSSPNGFSAPNVYLDDLPSSASYVIKTDGTYTWAVRYDGAISWNGTDAVTVIQSAIDVLTSGGKIFVTSGTYLITNVKIQPTSNIEIVGGGPSTIFKLADAGNVSIFQVNNARHLIFSDFAIDGNKANVNQNSSDTNQNAFYLNNVTNSVFTRLWIKNTLMHSIYVHSNCFDNVFESLHIEGAGRSGTGVTYSGQGNILISSAERNRVIACRLEGALARQLYFGYNCKNNIIKGCVFGGTAVGIDSDGYANARNIIEGNQFLTNTGIHLYGYEASPTYGTLIKGNVIYSAGDYGIYLQSFINNVSIEGNYVRNTKTGIRLVGVQNSFVRNNHVFAGATNNSIQEEGICDKNQIECNYVDRPIANVGANTKVRYNIGYATENSGTALMSDNSTVTLDHALVVIPITVQASFNCTGWGSWSWNASSTQITITTENSVNATVYWDARTWN